MILKAQLDRVKFYTHKSAQYSRLRRRWPHRFKRLIAYKTALTGRIQDERGRQRMQLTVVGKPIIRETADMIIVKDGDRVDSFNRKYYRQVNDAGEPVALLITRKLPVRIVSGLHGILAPVGR